MLELEKITATLHVTDLMKTIRFYESLGFEKDWLWPEKNPDQASLSNKGIAFMVKQVPSKDDIYPANLYFSVTGVEAFHTWVKSNIESCPDLVLQSYGMLDFTIIDLDGHSLSFGEPKGEYSAS